MKVVCLHGSGLHQKPTGNRTTRLSGLVVIILFLTSSVAFLTASKKEAFAYPAVEGGASQNAEVSAVATMPSIVLTAWSEGSQQGHFRHHHRIARAAGEPNEGPVGDWVECTISYTPSISLHISRIEPRRTDTYLFHKVQLQQNFNQLYTKLGFVMDTELLYKDIKTHCREPDNGLQGQCNDCFKLAYGGAMGFVGMATPKYWDRPQVSTQECIGDTMNLRTADEALPADKNRPEPSWWCMKEDTTAKVISTTGQARL